MKLHISKMGGKLEGIPAINTNTLTNKFCQGMREGDNICNKCYSQRALSSYRAFAAPTFQRNSDILSSPKPLEEIPIINALWFRFHAHGELINGHHYRKLCSIAEANPHCTFSLWTKRKDIVRTSTAYVPFNLIRIYSNPKVDSVMCTTPKYFDKVFNVVTGEHKRVNCQDKCMGCLKCYRSFTTNCIVERIK